MNEPPNPAPPRYARQRALPPYSYVPGKFPHPLSDPAGHSYGHTAAPQADEFAYAVDLFNHGYYWEAHEAWETLWHAAGRSGPRADLLKGLIKLAAAGVKAREGNARGVLRHARRAQELFASGDNALPSWREFAAQVERDASSLLNTSDDPVVRVFAELLPLATIDPL